MATTSSTTQGRSNAILDSTTIERLILLFEDLESWPDFFFEKGCVSTITDAQKEKIRKNFPWSDDFRRTIKRVAASIPTFKWSARQGLDETKVTALIEAANEMSELRTWEGEKNLWAANAMWREFVLLTGDTFIKFPKVDGVCIPERMSPQDTKIRSSQTRKKGIEGYRFQYPVGADANPYTTTGSQGQLVTEIVDAKVWTIMEPGAAPKSSNLSYGFIPVSHMAWEEREGNPRGLPLSLRLANIIVHIIAIKYGIRMGGKLNSFPIILLLNIKSALEELYPGLIMEADDASPTAKADVKTVGGDLTLTCLENELEQAERDLDRSAFLPHESREGSSGQQIASGRAMERLSAAQIAYRVSFMLSEASFLEDLAFKYLTVSGNPVAKMMKMGDLTPQYDGFGEDQTAILERAKALFSEGATQEALRVLGYEDDAIETIMEEIKQNKQDGFMSILGNMNNDQNTMEKKTPEQIAKEKAAAEQANNQ